MDDSWYYEDLNENSIYKFGNNSASSCANEHLNTLKFDKDEYRKMWPLEPQLPITVDFENQNQKSNSKWNKGSWSTENMDHALYESENNNQWCLESQNIRNCIPDSDSRVYYKDQNREMSHKLDKKRMWAYNNRNTNSESELINDTSWSYGDQHQISIRKWDTKKIENQKISDQEVYEYFGANYPKQNKKSTRPQKSPNNHPRIIDKSIRGKYKNAPKPVKRPRNLTKSINVSYNLKKPVILTQNNEKFAIPAVPSAPNTPGKTANNKDSLEDKKDDSELWEAQAAFLGPNLWDKTLPYDSDLKYVDLDEFLSENGMPGDGLASGHLGGPAFGHSTGLGLGGLPTQITKRERSPSPSECMSPDTINPPLSPADSTFSMASSGRDFDPRTRAFSDEELKPQPMIKKSRKQFVPDDLKDDKYWARRRKNNMAAKRSRDARRMKENQIAMRAGYLEKENMGLRQELEILKKENHILREKLSKLTDV